MPCDRTGEIDLAEFLLERAEPRFAEFRAHYPGCPDCAREVGRMARLEQALGHSAPGPAGPHPAEETLLAYAQTPTVLAFEERRALESHLEACAPCSSELAVLERFDFAAIGAEVSAPATPADTSLWQQLSEGLSGAVEQLSGWGVRPAFAAAAMAVVLLPLGWLWLSASPNDLLAPSPPRLAAQPAPDAEPPTRPGNLPDGPAETFLASESDPSLATVPDQPEPLDLTRLADAGAVPAAKQPAPEDSADASLEPLAVDSLVAGPDVTLLAAHWPDSPIRYGVDQIDLLGGASVRSHGSVRSLGSEPDLELRVLAPDHVGWTSEASPTLYYWLSQATELPIEITLADEVSVEPLVEHQRSGPHGPGLQAVSLAELGVQLEPGVIYRWQVAAVPDAARRSRDVRAGAAILWQVPDAARAAVLERAEAGERAHRLAEQGYWYDAFGQLSDWIGAGAEVAGLRDARAALLEQVDLEVSIERSVQ